MLDDNLFQARNFVTFITPLFPAIWRWVFAVHRARGFVIRRDGRLDVAGSKRRCTRRVGDGSNACAVPTLRLLESRCRTKNSPSWPSNAMSSTASGTTGSCLAPNFRELIVQLIIAKLLSGHYVVGAAVLKGLENLIGKESGVRA